MKPIILNALDVRRFRDAMEKERPKRRANHETIAQLQAQIDQARILPPEEMPDNIVTMNCVVRVRDTKSGKATTFHLVYPNEADPDLMKISILDPLGLAVIGCEAGSTVVVESPQDRKSIIIEKIHYQPESVKEYFR